MMRRGWPQPSCPTCRMRARRGIVLTNTLSRFLCSSGQSPTAVECVHIGYVLNVADRRRAGPHAFSYSDGHVRDVSLAGIACLSRVDCWAHLLIAHQIAWLPSL